VADVPLPDALSTYYRALDAGEMEAAATAFAPDAVYARPALEPGPDGLRPLVAIEGRAAILAWFRERGPRPFRHVVTSAVAEGPRVLVEGVVVAEGRVTQLFLASAVLTPDGLLARYVATTAAAGPDVVGRLGVEP
jgi:ketosteroid isomerase-like protein